MPDLADAHRRAESALRRVLANAAAIIRLSWSDGATAADRRNLERIKTAAADIAQDHQILRALLAALPGDDASAPTTLPPRSGGIGYMAKYNASCTDGLPSEHTQLAPSDAVREAAAEHRVEAKHRCCLDLLRSARLYFADGHPMRLAIERTLAERPGLSAARAAKGGAE